MSNHFLTSFKNKNKAIALFTATFLLSAAGAEAFTLPQLPSFFPRDTKVYSQKNGSEGTFDVGVDTTSGVTYILFSDPGNQRGYPRYPRLTRGINDPNIGQSVSAILNVAPRLSDGNSG